MGTSDGLMSAIDVESDFFCPSPIDCNQKMVFRYAPTGHATFPLASTSMSIKRNHHQQWSIQRINCDSDRCGSQSCKYTFGSLLKQVRFKYNGLWLSEALTLKFFHFILSRLHKLEVSSFKLQLFRRWK